MIGIEKAMDLSNFGSINLFTLQSKTLDRGVDAEVTGNRLAIRGYDCGDITAEWFGGCDCFDYDCYLDEVETKKLFEAIVEETGKPPKEAILVFQGSSCFEDFRAYCDLKGIKYVYFSWHSD